LDGTALESSVGGEPLEMGVTAVIDGWTEVLKLMPVGSKYEVWIPSALAYDAMGPQHQLYGKLLIFEMELLGIKE
jgi:FKBP-type peptidyl-prolyl cis-trans isomerase